MPMKVLLRDYEILRLKDILHVIKVLIVLSRVPHFILEYSLVTLSYQRFRAVFRKIEIQNEKKVSNFVKITLLWLLGILYGALCVTAQVFYDNSEGDSLDAMLTIRLYISTFIEVVIPGILVTVFSLLASRKLKKLSENFPGERSHHLQRIQDRQLAANTLILLIVLFLVTRIIQKIMMAMVKSRYTKIDSKVISEFARDHTNILYAKFFISLTKYVNSVVNPVVLYFLSSKFRRYFNACLHCRPHELD